MTPETLQDMQTYVTQNVLAFGLNALGAVLILVVGWWLSGVASSTVGRVLDRTPRMDATLRPLAISLTRYAVLIITVIAVLGRFGVQTTSIVAVFGAAGLAIVNYTRHPVRRFDLTIGIDYGDDMDAAIALVWDVLKTDTRIRPEPVPTVAVRNLGESSVDLVIRGFVEQKDFWPTVFATQKSVKETFDANGIHIPFPQRTLHLAPGALAKAVL